MNGLKRSKRSIERERLVLEFSIPRRRIVGNNTNNNVTNKQFESVIDNNQVKSVIDNNQVKGVIINSEVKSVVDNNQVKDLIDNAQVKNIVDSNQVRNLIDNSRFKSEVKNDDFNTTINKFKNDDVESKVRDDNINTTIKTEIKNEMINKSINVIINNEIKDEVKKENNILNEIGDKNKIDKNVDITAGKNNELIAINHDRLIIPKYDKSTSIDHENFSSPLISSTPLSSISSGVNVVVDHRSDLSPTPFYSLSCTQSLSASIPSSSSTIVSIPTSSVSSSSIHSSTQSLVASLSASISTPTSSVSSSSSIHSSTQSLSASISASISTSSSVSSSATSSTLTTKIETDNTKNNLDLNSTFPITPCDAENNNTDNSKVNDDKIIGDKKINNSDKTDIDKIDVSNSDNKPNDIKNISRTILSTLSTLMNTVDDKNILQLQEDILDNFNMNWKFKSAYVTRPSASSSYGSSSSYCYEFFRWLNGDTNSDIEIRDDENTGLSLKKDNEYLLNFDIKIVQVDQELCSNNIVDQEPCSNNIVDEKILNEYNNINISCYIKRDEDGYSVQSLSSNIIFGKLPFVTIDCNTYDESAQILFPIVKYNTSVEYDMLRCYMTVHLIKKMR